MSHTGGNIRTVGPALLKICFILHILVILFLYRLKLCNNSLAHGFFEIALAFTGKVVFNGFKAVTGNGTVNSHKVINSVLALGVMY